jgi:hypothetical protein
MQSYEEDENFASVYSPVKQTTHDQHIEKNKEIFSSVL